MAVSWHLQPGSALAGTLDIPGDKSVSHRAVMLGALADGVTTVSNFLEGEDTRATAGAFRAMGVRIDADGHGALRVEGRGVRGLRAPGAPLDLGNSGTGLRLMAGVLAGQTFDSVLAGDESLNGRPMRRIAEPLARMGAHIDTSASGTPPLRIAGGRTLAGIDYRMPVASAQVKSCLLLAGLYANGTTTVHSPAVCRDHTERMLRGFGQTVAVDGLTVRLRGGQPLTARDVAVPGDISSAAFFLVGATITPGSDLLLRNVGLNPSRRGVVDILHLMGADIAVLDEREAGGEPVADLRVRHSPLTGIDIPQALVANAIDEFPAIFVAAACARGRTTLAGAAELRVKESDRIGAMADGLTTLGARAEPRDDGMVIDGGPLDGGQVASRGDHRIAMALAMAAPVCIGPVTVTDCDNVATSFPGFVDLAAGAGLRIEARG